MNLIHKWLCQSTGWRRVLETRVPWALKGSRSRVQCAKENTIRISAIVVVTLSAVGSLFAQQKIIITGVRAPVPDYCVKQVQVLKDKLIDFEGPGKPWTWVVACTEQSWNLIVRTAQDSNTCCAFSILDKGYTYINGARLTDPLAAVTPGYLVAHECGHIATGSTKEEDADKWAKQRGYQLEIGPGFGVATDFVQPLVERLTCVEVESVLTGKLRRRMFGKNVTVLCEDATSTSLEDDLFDAVVCFTMLHHVPSPELQDQILKEVARVLRPGGVLAGTDSLYGWRFRLLRIFGTMVVVNPSTLPERLRPAGFIDIDVDADASALRFRARKPFEEIAKEYSQSASGVLQ